MNKQMTLSTSNNTINKFNDMACCVANITEATRNMLNAPLQLLRRYYSTVLERPVDTALTKALTTTQMAFFLTILPADYSLVIRFAACAWFIKSLLRCRSLLTDNQ